MPVTRGSHPPPPGAGARPDPHPGSTTPARRGRCSPRRRPPQQPAESWTLSPSTDSSSRPASWTWSELHAFPGSTFFGDIHCVTTWSKLDITFSGVSVDDLLDVALAIQPASFVMAHSVTGYTTNLPLADLTGGRAWIVWDRRRQAAPPPARRTAPAPRAAPLLPGSRRSGSRASS